VHVHKYMYKCRAEQNKIFSYVHITRLVEPHWNTIQRFNDRVWMTMTVVVVVLQLHVRESSMVVIIRLLLPASRSRIISTRV